MNGSSLLRACAASSIHHKERNTTAWFCPEAGTLFIRPAGQRSEDSVGTAAAEKLAKLRLKLAKLTKQLLKNRRFLRWGDQNGTHAVAASWCATLQLLIAADWCQPGKTAVKGIQPAGRIRLLPGKSKDGMFLFNILQIMHLCGQLRAL